MSTTMPLELPALLRALPKAELHVHLEGSLRPQLLLALAARSRLKLPIADVSGFDRLYDYRNFRDFANALLLGVACLRTPQDFFDAVSDVGGMLAGQNVRYAEVTWGPQFYAGRCSLDDILDAMNAARLAVHDAGGPVLRWITDLVRSHPQPAAAAAAWASSPKARDGGVVALGLGGPEAGHPAAQFADVFARARAAGLPANPHAGESDGPASVWSTLESLQPTRIGHGVRSIEDPKLVAHLAATRIPLDINLTSNVRLGVVPSYEAHPAKRLLDAGCVVTLNSDDPVLFRTTMTDEYRHAIERCGFTLRDVVEASRTALRCSYLGEAEKSAMLVAFEAEFRRLGVAA
jgi:adenosine deaminase